VVLKTSELLPMLEQAVLRPALMTSLGHSQDTGAVPALVEGLIERARGAREAALVGLYRLYHSLDENGQLIKRSVANIYEGHAERRALANLGELRDLGANRCRIEPARFARGALRRPIELGAERGDRGDEVGLLRREAKCDVAAHAVAEDPRRRE